MPVTQDSPLLNLPPELRNRIYSYALNSPSSPIGVRATYADREPPTVLQLSRQIREEATSLYYSEWVFTGFFDGGVKPRKMESLCKWLKSLTPEIHQRLRHIVIYHSLATCTYNGVDDLNRHHEALVERGHSYLEA
jgi:hypothetical protein